MLFDVIGMIQFENEIQRTSLI